jgi:hypothetical protein
MENVSGVHLVMLIDDTGSMQNDMNATTRALTRIITELETSAQTPPTIALITFKDDYTVRIVTDDMTQLRNAVQNLRASGGGLCPEASVEATAKAFEMVKNGGKVLLITDASPHADTDGDEILKTMLAKGLSYSVMLSGNCETGELINELADEVLADNRETRRRNTRIDVECDPTSSTVIADARYVYSCLAEHTGGVYKWHQAVKSGSEAAIVALENDILQVLQAAVEAANTVEPSIVTPPKQVTTDDEPTITIPEVNPPTVVNITNKTVSNSIMPADYLTLSIGSVNGRLVDEKVGIDCNHEACSFLIKRGTKVHLTAQPDTGTFLFMNDDTDKACFETTFEMSDNKNCPATFYGIPGYQQQ